MGGAFMGQMDGAVIFFGRCLKILVFRGVPFPGPCMTTGFGPFELPTRELLSQTVGDQIHKWMAHLEKTTEYFVDRHQWQQGCPATMIQAEM